MDATKGYAKLTALMVIMGFDWAWSGNEYQEDKRFWAQINMIEKDKEKPFYDYAVKNGKKTKTPVPARLKLVLATIARLVSKRHKIRQS